MKAIFGTKVSDEELEKTARLQDDTKKQISKALKSFGLAYRTASKRVENSKYHAAIFGNNIFDPGSHFILLWDRVFLFSCFIALFVDPLVFYWPLIKVLNDNSSCIELDRRLVTAVTCVRSLSDLFYALRIAIKFHTAYVAPSSKVFGKGELVMDRKKIAKRYIKSEFVTDLAASLPVTQIVIWAILPAVRSSNNIMVVLIVLIQYVLRLYLIYPLSSQIIEATGVITKSAWGGAVYNLLLYILASHIIGSIWYLLLVGRQATCWKNQCDMEGSYCNLKYLDCKFATQIDRQSWTNNTQTFSSCDVKNQSSTFNFGIFLNGLDTGVASTTFVDKYFYSLWWGLQQLTSAGQNMISSTFIGETIFACGVAILSLVLFAQLIGNMQTYLQSITSKIEEWRLKQRDTEEWMSHHQLPHELRERVRHFNRHKWLATRGVAEETVLRGLPADIRRDIRRHLCLDLVKQVAFFSEMDSQLLDAICERLVASLSIEGAYIVRQGDLVTEMLFIIRGNVQSFNIDESKPGYNNSIVLKPGDFCGEELLTWALDPRHDLNLPSSTRSLRALSEVEAFALRANDLKFVANQFRKMHSKLLQHKFRLHSQQWRLWAACLIQTAWRRCLRRKKTKDFCSWESFSSRSDNEANSASVNPECGNKDLMSTSSESKSASSSRRYKPVLKMPKFQKPDEPDFYAT